MTFRSLDQFGTVPFIVRGQFAPIACAALERLDRRPSREHVASFDLVKIRLRCTLFIEARDCRFLGWRIEVTRGIVWSYKHF